jgi:hypothetical protein
VDVSDPYDSFVPEDLSFNEQESIVEFLIEYCFGYSDAMVEYDDNDLDGHLKKKNSKFDFLVHCDEYSEQTHFICFKENLSGLNYKDFLIGGFHQIDSPPPKF